MKICTKLSGYSVILVVMLLLYGCPVSTSHPLSNPSDEKVDEKFLGTWKNDSANVEVTEVSIARRSETTYDVHVITKGAMFMAESSDFRGWTTTIDGHRFFVFMEMIDGKTSTTYYTYHVEMAGDKLRSNDISLKVGGTDAITSIETYREEVKASIPKDGFLAGEIMWSKVK